jgi:predicted nuclease of restriction endonuclease-like (RecB) superfamily
MKNLPATSASTSDFPPILDFIHRARSRALSAVNHELVDLYWRVGEYLSVKVSQDGWGKGTVQQLAHWLLVQEPNLRGFSASNLWRMRQFYEAYSADEKLATVLRELPWSSNLHILSKCKSAAEREFYLTLAVRERWDVRQVARQIDGCLFERVVTSKPQLAPVLRANHANAESIFKDSYLLDFLDLPLAHSEQDLRRGLIANLKHFLLELGRDFCFIGEEFRLQVGAKDFFIDLLFFHRGLQAQVAFELKIDDFQPAYLGQLAFYLEALDRDHKKTHEAPSIGVLLCKSQDHEVVEYALSRSLSPTLVAEYLTQLPDKALLQAKLDEFYALANQSH